MSNSLNPVTTQPERVVRVYFASILQDMSPERDVLERKIFPELGRLCRKRHVEFVAVHPGSASLDPDRNQSEILALRLTEIDKCRPFFVALLGTGYGTILETVDPELMAKYLWLVEHLEKSVLEIDILHGALNDPSPRRNVFFYFRDDTHATSSSLSGSPDRPLDHVGSANKLQALKNRIRSSGLPLRDTYPDPEALGRFVLEDLWAAIDRMFPAAGTPDRLTRLADEHAAFARSRTSAWVLREDYCEVLDAHVQGSYPPLVMSGEDGSGKAALLANWVARYRIAHPDDSVIVHFMEGTPRRCDPCAMMVRVMEEIKRRCGGEEILPDCAEKVSERLPFWLNKAQGNGRAILVIHGLDRLALEDERISLDWPQLARTSGLRVILSAAPGPVLSKLEQLGGPRLEVEGLRPHERHEAIVQFLGLHRWPLAQHHVERIAQAPQTANPVFLRSCLEHLRVCGRASADPETLVNACLQAQTIPQLHDTILGSWESDYNKHHSHLVSNALTLLWAARSGLYESELLHVLTELGQDTAFEVWTPFFSAFSPFLVHSSGLLSFFHQSFRDAVKNRYLKTEAAVKARHLRLALYFLHCKADDRKVEELPWQLKQAEAWDSLKSTITDPSMFRRLSSEPRRCALTDYWLRLTELYDMPREFEKAAARYDKTGPSGRKLAALLVRMADFLDGRGAHEVSERLYRRALQLLDSVQDRADLNTAAILDKLVALLLRKGESEAAEPYHQKALEIRQQLLGRDHPDISTNVYEAKRLFATRGD
jgi:nephrocystin-3